MLVDFATSQDIEGLKAMVAAVLTQLGSQAAAPAADEMLSVDEVAEYTRFHRRTVEKWATEGDWNEQGKRVYLQAYKYSGRLRFKRSDVEAFGLGTGVLEPSIAGEPPQPTKKAPEAKESKKKNKLSDSERFMRAA
jgi:excisionase family DNA binding protein